MRQNWTIEQWRDAALFANQVAMLLEETSGFMERSHQLLEERAEFLQDQIPEKKPRGRPRTKIRNALYVRRKPGRRRKYSRKDDVELLRQVAAYRAQILREQRTSQRVTVKAALERMLTDQRVSPLGRRRAIPKLQKRHSDAKKRIGKLAE